MYNIIIGTGNLGTALFQKFKYQNQLVMIFNRPDINTIIDKANLLVLEGHVVTVWNTEGYGSIPECKKNPREAFEVHVMRNLDLLAGLHKNILLINFSTNYVDQEPKSEYAASKACMESLTKNFPREKVITIRVANLYSKYFPLKAFQGKILKNRDKVDALPCNAMIPTDCDWLVKEICDRLFTKDNAKHLYGKVIQIAPSGMISAAEFGRIIICKKIEKTSDETRPLYPIIENTWNIKDSWYDVWINIKDQFMENYHEAIEKENTKTKISSSL